MAFEHLVVEKRGPVGWLVLNRPERHNALGVRLFEELPRAWMQLDADDDVRVIVNSGAGEAFCSGLDLKELAADPARLAVHAQQTRENRLRLTALHNRVRKPVICAVNGVCAGGGLHFVADADIVIAACTATFLEPHVSVGQVAVFETIGLRARMPFEAVARMLLVGRHEALPAQRAYELGMLSQVVEPAEALWDEAQALSEKIARNSPSAMMVSKRALWDSLDDGLSASLDHGARLLADFWRHPDSREGPAAFAERRDPAWQPPPRREADG